MKTFCAIVACVVVMACLSCVAGPIHPAGDVDLVYDLDGNGQVDIMDVVIWQITVAIEGPGYLNLEMDYNPDQVLDWMDVVDLVHYAGYEVGDWNMDGNCDAADAAHFWLRYNQDLNSPGGQGFRDYRDCDIDGDGKCTSSDAVIIMIINPDFPFE